MRKLNIVAYGDSNTYGYAPDGLRYDIRYGTELERLLKKDVKVYEEGVVGRTTIYSDERPGRKGIDSVKDELLKYEEIDLLIIMLGTNDYKVKNARTLSEVEYGMEKFLKKVKSLNNIKNILLVSPILLDKNIEDIDTDFDYNSYIISKCVSSIYEWLAKKYNLFFYDAKHVAFPGSDGEHFTQESHIALGNALANFIEECILL